MLGGKEAAKIGLFQGDVWLLGGSDGGPPWSQLIYIRLLGTDEVG